MIQPSSRNWILLLASTAFAVSAMRDSVAELPLPNGDNTPKPEAACPVGGMLVPNGIHFVDYAAHQVRCGLVMREIMPLRAENAATHVDGKLR